jgi:hypothetical protein
MSRSFTSLLVAGLLSVSASSAFAAKTVTKYSFSGFNSTSQTIADTTCPDGSAQDHVTQQLAIFGSDRITKATGVATSSVRNVVVSYRFDQCDGSSYVGYAELDDSGYTGSLSGSTINKTFVATRSLPMTDEFGGLSWVPTTQTVTISVSTVLVPNGDSVVGKSSSVVRQGNTIVSDQSDGTTKSANVTMSAKINNAPVNFAQSTAFGELVQSSGGTRTVTKN